MPCLEWLKGRRKTVTTKDRTLFFGLNRYPGAPLRGCVNDVTDMRRELEASYRGSETETRALLDGDATTSNMKDALRWLADTPEGARKFLHYSGHGAQVESRFEVDGYLEVVCPIDFDWSPERMVTDKDFVEIFYKAKRGSPFTWISDSCHSGDLDRSMARLGAPLQIARAYPSLPYQLLKVHKKMRRSLRREIEEMFDVAFISGCRSDQTSADTVVDGRPCGALTSYFLKTLKANRNASHEELGALTRQALRMDEYDQEPQTDGPRAGLPFWS